LTPTEPDVRPLGDGAQVTVYGHQITNNQPIDCWTYITQGLTQFGQREMSLTLRHERGDATYPEEPLQFFATILQFSKEGRIVGNGGFTQLGSRRFFGRHLLYMYLMSPPVEGVKVEPGTLALILVTDDEIEAVKNYGSLRVASRLGKRERYYPYPIWNERTAPARGVFAQELANPSSLLAKMPKMRGSEVFVNQYGNTVMMQPTVDAGVRIAEALKELPPGDALAPGGRLPPGTTAMAPGGRLPPGTTAMALLTDLNPLSDACLVWQPGQRGPEAISPPGSKGETVAGCFVAFIPDQDADEVRVFEDGFALMIRNDTWANIRRAIDQQTEVAFTPSTAGLKFELRWRTPIEA